MHLMTLGQSKKLTPNECMDIYLENGKIKVTEVRKRWIGLLTLGISTYFTRPCINVHGLRDCLNQAKYQKIRADTIYECINYLDDDFDMESILHAKT